METEEGWAGGLLLHLLSLWTTISGSTLIIDYSDSCYWVSCQELSTIHLDLPLFRGRAATFDAQCVAVLLWKLHQSQGGKQKGCKFGGSGMNMRKMNWKLCTSQNITPPIYSSNPQLYSWFAVPESFFFSFLSHMFFLYQRGDAICQVS